MFRVASVQLCCCSLLEEQLGQRRTGRQGDGGQNHPELGPMVCFLPGTLLLTSWLGAQREVGPVMPPGSSRTPAGPAAPAGLSASPGSPLLLVLRGKGLFNEALREGLGQEGL